MFTKSDLALLLSITEQKYQILVSNCHDITLSSMLTGHEWIIVSAYGKNSCYILHRHSRIYPFHRQQGRYPSLEAALKYIEGHDLYFSAKKAGRDALP